MSGSEIVLKPSESYKVTLGDKSYSFKKPTARQVSEFQVRLSKQKDEAKTLDELIEFLSSLGLPKQFLESLDIDQLTQLTEGFSKKK